MKNQKAARKMDEESISIQSPKTATFPSEGKITVVCLSLLILLYVMIAVTCSVYNSKSDKHKISAQLYFPAEHIVHQIRISQERTLLVATNEEGYICIIEMGMEPLFDVAFFPDVSTITSSFIMGTNGTLTEYDIEKNDSVAVWEIKSIAPALLQRNIAFSEHGVAKLKTLEVGFQTSTNEIEQLLFQYAVGEAILYISEYAP